MVIRKLTLSEWFLNYQLQRISRGYFFNPLFVDVETERLEQRFQGQGKLPVTAILIKAAALLRKKSPKSHRALLHSFLGPRMIEFSESRINVPILLDIDGKKHLSAVIIQHPEGMSVDEIDRNLRDQAKYEPGKFPITRFCATSSNHFFNRFILKCIYAIAYKIPSFFAKRGGGISVSSMLGANWKDSGMAVTAFGPTSLTITVVSFSKNSSGKRVLKLGVGYNHSVWLAKDCMRAVNQFANILNGNDRELFEELCRGTQETIIESKQESAHTAIHQAPCL